ncbi:hypothetical protein B9Z19DRAFT_1063488 [Tuber borchii]|uniref:Uncharacterized protein n=1 Tax=Tuber borchii TaxID=42251 RepID=A0A2T6ZY28_TUBBO|nr:hypothetical protein B9Z19DRAFT_1063488 [Tuber borchii]
MDEEYASRDNSSYPQLPSFFDSAFDVNDLPLRRRGWPGEHQPIITPSSFLQTEHDSCDDDFIAVSKSNRNDSGLIRPLVPSWKHFLTSIGLPTLLIPTDSQRPQPNYISGSLLVHGLNENVNPKENGVGGIMAAGGRSKLAHDPSDDGRHLEPMVVKKYRRRVLEHEGDSTRHGAHFLRSTQSLESGFSVRGGHDSTLISKIQDESTDSKYLIPIPATDSSKITSRHRAHESPEKKTASPLPPLHSDNGTLNTTQHLDYQQYVNLDKYCHDSIDSSRHGPDECSTRAGRISGSHTDMLGMSVFFGGNQALFFGRKDLEFTSDETEILGPEFPRNPTFFLKALKPLRIPRVVAHGTAEHELGLIPPTPEKPPSTPFRQRFQTNQMKAPQ